MKKEELFNIIGEIDEHKVNIAGRAMTTKKKSHSVWVKWGTMAACLCLVVCAFVLQGNHGAADPQLNGNHGTSIIQPAQSEKENLIVVNEIDNIMSADMDVQFSFYNDLSIDEREIILKAFETTIGLSYDDFTSKIPDTYAIKSFYSLDVPADATRIEYIPHDYVFEYQTENGGKAKVAICSLEEPPMRDCFIKCDNPKQSEVNDNTVLIYGLQDSFMVQFSYKNVNYDIETRNITLEELEDLLMGIMK